MKIKTALIRSMQASLIMIAFAMSWMAVDSYFNSDFRLFESILLSGMCGVLDVVCITGAISMNEIFND